MSRALDKETAAALRCGDPQAAYRAIAGVLTEPSSPSSGLLEIEFLGRGLSLPTSPADGGSGYFLRDGNAVAIPKLALVQAFFVARRVLQRHRAAAALPSSSPPPSTDDVLAASAVILLFDPEHLTAANTRKRIVQSRVDRAAAVAAERRLVDSLLTSHLHRHTKSPTLWSHRRWLVSLARDGERGEAQRGIVDVVMVAAVRHPRNYYAWDHARWLVATQSGGGSSVDAVGAVDVAVAALLPAVRNWCYRHHDDTSGWSFLLLLLLAPSPAAAQTHLDDTLSQVEHMAASLRWTGESVWVFLRTAAAAAAAAASRSTGETGETDGHGHGHGHCDRLRQTARALQGSGLDPLSQDWRVLQQAQDWCSTCSSTAVAARPERECVYS